MGERAPNDTSPKRDRHQKEMLRESLQRLEQAATEVARAGAVTGSQWGRLSDALASARTTLLSKAGDAHVTLQSREEQAAEKERLRFEGNLDDWMKIIGAGITGHQPEAYAVMDWACAELVRRRDEALRFSDKAAAIAESAFDDRPRIRAGSADWNDGFLDGTRAAAEAIRAAFNAFDPSGRGCLVARERAGLPTPSPRPQHGGGAE